MPVTASRPASIERLNFNDIDALRAEKKAAAATRRAEARAAAVDPDVAEFLRGSWVSASDPPPGSVDEVEAEKAKLKAEENARLERDGVLLNDPATPAQEAWGHLARAERDAVRAERSAAGNGRGYTPADPKTRPLPDPGSPLRLPPRTPTVAFAAVTPASTPPDPPKRSPGRPRKSPTETPASPAARDDARPVAGPLKGPTEIPSPPSSPPAGGTEQDTCAVSLNYKGEAVSPTSGVRHEPFRTSPRPEYMGTMWAAVPVVDAPSVADTARRARETEADTTAVTATIVLGPEPVEPTVTIGPAPIAPSVRRAYEAITVPVEDVGRTTLFVAIDALSPLDPAARRRVLACLRAWFADEGPA